MADIPAEPPKDALGLDLDSLKLTDELPQPSSEPTEQPQPAAAEQSTAPDAPAAPQDAPAPSADDAADAASPTEGGAQEQGATGDAKKAHPRPKKPYVNPERVKTGGNPRVCISASPMRTASLTVL